MENPDNQGEKVVKTIVSIQDSNGEEDFVELICSSDDDENGFPTVKTVRISRQEYKEMKHKKEKRDADLKWVLLEKAKEMTANVDPIKRYIRNL